MARPSVYMYAMEYAHRRRVEHTIHTIHVIPQRFRSRAALVLYPLLTRIKSRIGARVGTQNAAPFGNDTFTSAQCALGSEHATAPEQPLDSMSSGHNARPAGDCPGLGAVPLPPPRWLPRLQARAWLAPGGGVDGRCCLPLAPLLTTMACRLSHPFMWVSTRCRFANFLPQ